MQSRRLPLPVCRGPTRIREKRRIEEEGNSLKGINAAWKGSVEESYGFSSPALIVRGLGASMA